MNLRPYQRQAIDVLYAWFREHDEGNPLLVLPTGSGKAVIIATLIREILQTWPGQRILMLTHVKELIAQNAHKLLTVWPQAPLGIHSAGLRRKDCFEPVIFAGIQSVHAKAMQLGRFDLILIDECHLVSHNAQGMYRSFLEAARGINPGLRVIGLTATPFRTGHGSIMHGKDALFHGIAFQVGMLDLIRDGYLAPLISKRMATKIDLSGVQVQRGEYVQKQLEQAVDREEITQAALDEVERYGGERKRWLLFCAGVAHAEHVAEALRARAIPAGCVTGKTRAGERDKLIAMYRAGHLRALTNANVLTTGFDAPETDLLVMLRPTHSPGLYVQMAGRGTRVAPGKSECLVLDFAGKALRHGPVDQVEAWIPRPRDSREAPSKTCPQCATVAAASTRVCSQCGYEFPFEERPPHEAQAGNAAMLSIEADPVIERHDITTVYYRLHPGKWGKPPTLRVDYYDSFVRVASEWICFEHQCYPRAKAAQWWLRRAPGTPVPAAVAGAISQSELLIQPRAITVNTRGKFPEILSYEFPDSDIAPDAQREAEHDPHTRAGGGYRAPAP